MWISELEKRMLQLSLTVHGHHHELLKILVILLMLLWCVVESPMFEAVQRVIDLNQAVDHAVNSTKISRIVVRIEDLTDIREETA